MHIIKNRAFQVEKCTPAFSVSFRKRASKKFTHISQLQYQSKFSKEHIWLGRSKDSNVYCILAGTLLGSEVIRIRAIPGIELDESRYQLSDDETGTLPYHSWIVTRGDEKWPDFLNESQVQATLEPYLQTFSFVTNPFRLIIPLARRQRIHALG